MMADDPLLLPVSTTAERLGVSTDLVYDLVRCGQLPCVRLGTRVLIPARVVDLLVEHALDGFELPPRGLDGLPPDAG